MLPPLQKRVRLLRLLQVIDGELQCNRVRRDIHMPRKGVNPRLCEARFIVRGNEIFGEDEFLYIRDWHFQDAGEETGPGQRSETREATALGMNPCDAPVGTIRVVVLRCALTRDEKAWVDPFGAFPNVAGLEEKLREGRLQSPLKPFRLEDMDNESAGNETFPKSGNWLPDLPSPLGKGIFGSSANRSRADQNTRSNPPYRLGGSNLGEVQSKKTSRKAAMQGTQLPSEAVDLSETSLAKNSFFLSLMEERARFRAKQKKHGVKEVPGTGAEMADMSASQQKSGSCTHRTKLGSKYSFCSPLRTPRYLDDGERPYATFIFKYRSKGASPWFKGGYSTECCSESRDMSWSPVPRRREAPAVRRHEQRRVDCTTDESLGEQLDHSGEPKGEH